MKPRLLFAALAFILAACQPAAPAVPATPSLPPVTVTPSPLPSATATLTPSPTSTPEPTPTPTALPPFPWIGAAEYPPLTEVLSPANISQISEIASLTLGSLQSMQVSAGGNFMVLETASGLKVYTLGGAGVRVEALEHCSIPLSDKSAFVHPVISPDERWVVASTTPKEEGPRRLLGFNLTDCQPAFTIELWSSMQDWLEPHHLAISSDSAHLAFAASDHVRIFSLPGGELETFVPDVLGGSGTPWEIEYFPDGRLGIRSSNHFAIWEPGAERAELLLAIQEPNGARFTLSPDGTLLLVAGEQIRLYQVDGMRLVNTWDIRFALTAFTPDSSHILAYTRRNLQLIRVADGETISPQDGLTNPDGDPQGMAVIRDGQALIAAADTGVTFAQLSGNQSTLTGQIDLHPVSAFTSLSADDLLAYADLSDEAVILRRASDGVELSRYTEFFPGGGSLAFSPDMKVLAVGVSGSVMFYNAGTGQWLRKDISFAEHESPASLVFCGEDRIAAYVGSYYWGSDKTSVIYVWNIADGSPAIPPMSVPGEVPPPACSPDGKTLAVGRGIQLFDLETGQPTQTLTGLKGTSSLSFSPDGKHLAGGIFVPNDEGITGWDDNIRIWDLDTGEVVLTMESYVRLPIQVEYSPDGALLATYSYAQVEVWDAGSGELLLRMPSPGNDIEKVTFAAGGRALVLIAMNDAPRIYAVPPSP